MPESDADARRVHRMMRPWSLRTRFVSAAALCLIPIIAVSLYLLDASLDHSQDQLVDADFAISDVVAQGITATIDENLVALSELGKDERIQSMVAPEAQETLGQFRTARPSLNGVFLLGPTGTVVASAGGVDPAALLPQFSDITDRALNGGEPGVSGKLTVADGNIEVIALVQPVLPDPASTTQGQPIGAVGSFLNVERLEQAFVPASGYASGATTIAVVAEGQVIATSTGEVSGGNVITREVLAEPVPTALSGKRVEFDYSDGAGDQRLAVVAPIPHPLLSWAVVVTSPTPMNYGPNQSLLRNGLIALAIAAGLALLLATIFAELTARPLRQLSVQAQRIAAGAVDEPIQPVGRGEVADLSDAIRDMADRLTSQVRDTEVAREEVAIQAERLRELLRRTVRLQEDERRRIAADIHDAVSPLITGALYQTRAIQLGGTNGNGDHDGANSALEEADTALCTVNELLERAMAELHDVIFALRPPDLDDLGVVAAIERYVGQINRTGLPCHLDVVGEPLRLSPEARLGVYRIVQEALHNALRHAHADEATVRMEWLEDRLRVTVHDNGSGFDPELHANPNSLGLLSMRERAAAVGGTLEIISRSGAGTAIVLDRPHASDIAPELPNELVGLEDEPAGMVTSTDNDGEVIAMPRELERS